MPSSASTFSNFPLRDADIVAHIDISYPHDRSPEQTHQAIEQMAEKLREKFSMKTHWEQETLRFSGIGIDGRIDLLPQQVRVTAQLGFLLATLQDTITAEIKRELTEKLG